MIKTILRGIGLGMMFLGLIFAVAKADITLWYLDGTTLKPVDATWSIDVAGVGDVTAVGDCTTGACFGGATGTSLTFNNAGGDGILNYDGTDFNVDKSFTLGTAGVRLSGDGDGAITFLGLGNGFDEDLTLNLDDTTNVGTFTSSTLLATLNFSSIALQESGIAVLNNDEIDASSELLAIMDDETGSGLLVFGTSPVLTTPDINAGTADALTSLGIRSTGTGAFDLVIANTENLTVSAKTLTITLNNANRTLTVSGDATVTGSNTGDQTITLTGDVTGTGTGSFAATIAADSVALATDTTGNFVAAVTTSVLTGLTGGNAAAENTTSALALDYTATLAADPALAASICVHATTGIICEGLTVDGIETLLIFTDPTVSDKTITFPNASITVNAAGDLSGATLAAGVTASSLTSVGTIATGVWSATDIALDAGGTNASLTASNGGIFYSTASAGAILAGTATAGQMLRSGATAAPTWSTATFPATATGTGTIIRADGTNWVASTNTFPDTAAVSTILYASATNVISALATANSGILNTGATGIPSITATPIIGTSLQVGIAGTSLGSLKIAGNTSGVITITGAAAAGTYTLTMPTDDGTASQFLQTDGAGVLIWASGGTGDVTSVGDCASGLCFDGTQGTTLTFNNAGGDKTLDYDGTDFLFSAPLSVDATDPADAGAIRLDNAENIAWEAAPAGTDMTLGVDASEILQFSGVFNATAMTEGTIAVLNNDEIDASSELLAIMDDETGTGVLVFGTSPTITTSLTQDGDAADAGYLRLQNAAIIGWEASPAGTDVTLTVDASEILQASGAFTAAGLITGNANLTVGNGAATAGVLTLLEDTDAGTNFASFQVPALAANTVYTLPTTDGAASEFLQTDGSGTLTWAAAGGTPVAHFSTAFETAARHTSTLTSGGTATYGVGGLVIDTSATISSASKVRTEITGAAGLEAGSPTYSAFILVGANGTDFQSFFGLGNLTVDGSGITYTGKHIGFKVTRAASGTRSLYATQADGTTETASAALQTVGLNVNLDLIFKVNSTTSVDYYSRLSDGSLSAATNMTANMPTTVSQWVLHAVSNAGVATGTDVYLEGFSYQR